MSNTSPGLETLHFDFEAGTQVPPPFAPVLVGVVGSGNLEVLLERAADAPCAFDVQTSARGFGEVWRAVLADFHERHPLRGVHFSINDMGATPAVVSLRLQQAAAELP
jgi:malonate decarboxylase delta subunit